MPIPQCLLCCIAQLFEMQHNYILTAKFQNKENKEGLTHGKQGVLSTRLTVNPLKIFMQNTIKTEDSFKDRHNV